VEHLHTLLSLEVPSAERIKKVQSLIDNIAEFHTCVGSQDEGLVAGAKPPYTPLKEALWQCSNEFNKKGNSFGDQDFKRVWLFTNDDNPNCKYPAEQLQIIQVGKDLSETGVEVSLWFLNRPLNAPSASSAVPSTAMFVPFNIDIFYNKILVCDEEDLALRTREVADEGFEEMLSSVRRKQFRKRRMGSLTFYLGGDPATAAAAAAGSSGGGATALAVHFYKTLSVTKKPYAATLHSLTNQPVVVRTQYLDGSTGEKLDETSSTDIETYIDVQGTRVPFSKAEIQTITRARAAGFAKADTVSEEAGVDISDQKTGAQEGGFLKLLYFTAQTSIPIDLNISTSYFLAPDEKGIRGSSLLFTTLLDDLHAKQLVGVGVFVRNKNSAPRVVAILPQREGEVHSADGLFLTPLPFAGDLRSTASSGAVAEAGSVSEEAFHATMAVVRGMQLDPSVNHCARVPNPTMQRFYTVLQTIALSENIDQVALDGLDAECFPDKDVFVREHAAFEEYREALQLDTMEVSGAIVGKKRPNEGTGAGASKKAKDAGPVASVAEKEEYRDMAQNGELKKENVASLKEICRALGLGTTGKKDELVAKISTAVL